MALLNNLSDVCAHESLVSIFFEEISGKNDLEVNTTNRNIISITIFMQIIYIFLNHYYK